MENLTNEQLQEIEGGNLWYLTEAFAEYVDETYFDGAIGDFFSGDE